MTVLADTATYANSAFGVQLEHPANWQPDLNYESYDSVESSFADPRGREYGFFLVDACCSGDIGLDEAAELQARHKLKPFGEQPSVTSVQLSAGEGRLILPDGSAPDPYSAALVVPYKSPRQISSTGTYKFFILYAHKEFIRDIGQSLRFTN